MPFNIHIPDQVRRNPAGLRAMTLLTRVLGWELGVAKTTTNSEEVGNLRFIAHLVLVRGHANSMLSEIYADVRLPMPRLSSALIARAYRHHPFLPLLLRECRTIESARNELRWLKERANRLSTKKEATHRVPISREKEILWSMCRARSRGIPLQYILGDQPFGDLEILCRKGVLIPR